MKQLLTRLRLKHRLAAPLVAAPLVAAPLAAVPLAAVPLVAAPLAAAPLAAAPLHKPLRLRQFDRWQRKLPSVVLHLGGITGSCLSDTAFFTL